MTTSTSTEVPPKAGVPAGAAGPAGTPNVRHAGFVPVRRGSARKLWQWLLVLIVIALAAGGYMAFTWFNRPPAEVSPAKRGTAVSAVYGTVRIEYSYQELVKAENSGYMDLGPDIKSGVLSVGSPITKGQLLGTIRDDNNQRQLNQSQTELDAAQKRQKLGPPSLEPLRSAQDRLSRLEKSPGSVPEGDLISARNTVNQLTAQVESEKTELQRAVDQATLNVKNFTDQLEKNKIRSPMDGYLVASPPVDHDLVFQNNPLFTIATRSVYVSGQVNEEDVGDLREGMTAELKLYAYGNREFTAKLAAVLPSVDTTDQRYTVVLWMDNPPDNLRAGLTGEMNIIIGKHEDSLLIPASSLRGPDQVFIVEKDVVKPRTVKIGYRNPENVEVLDGLKEGDLVIVVDQDLFRVGERVRAVSRAPEKAEGKKKP